MDSREAMRRMLDGAGLSPYAASLKMGRAHSYVRSVLARKGGAAAGTVAAVARVCGWRLVLVPDSEPLPAGALELGD